MTDEAFFEFLKKHKDSMLLYFHIRLMEMVIWKNNLREEA